LRAVISNTEVVDWSPHRRLNAWRENQSPAKVIRQIGDPYEHCAADDSGPEFILLIDSWQSFAIEGATVIIQQVRCPRAEFRCRQPIGQRRAGALFSSQRMALLRVAR